MGKKSEQGNVIELIIIGVLLLAVAGLIAWRVVDSITGSKTTNQTASTQQNQNAVPPTTTGKEEPTNTGVPENTTAKYLVVSEWGVRFPYSSDDTLSYVMSDDSSFISVVSKKLVALDSECQPLVHNPMPGGGAIERVVRGQSTTSTALGGYVYMFVHDQAGCSSKQDVLAYQSSVNDLVKSIVSKVESSH